MINRKKPIRASGNIAVWYAKELQNCNTIYNVSFENADQQRTIVSVFSNIAGHELKPDEIIALAAGKSVKIVDQTENGPSIFTIVNRGTETKISEKDGEPYVNNTLLLGVAFHKLTPEGKIVGYLCNGINFSAESGDIYSQRSISLTPQDCFKLLDGLPVIKDGKEAFLRYIDEISPSSTANSASNAEEKTYKTARLVITKQINEQFFHRNTDIKSDEEQEITMKI